MSQLSNQSLVALVESAKAAAGVGDTAKVHLCKDNFIPNPMTTAADMVTHEADYDGYAPSAVIVWGEAYIKPDGSCAMPGSSQQFIPAGSTTSNTIYSYWLETGVSPTNKLVSFKVLDQPVTLSTPYDSVVIVPEFKVMNGVPAG